MAGAGLWMENRILANFDGKENAAYIHADPLQGLLRLVKTAAASSTAGVPITAVKEHLNSSGIPARTA
ncbi:hypothetical protein D9Q98_003122 [Chlorella vulgaris]|uniref:Uncharacterized protein n=1 Tax=Chlorella vulgaris TaxID=3077 RepID=A0A9D4TRZ8_CHLVU|nr:hypothetical protein D9Q98_003122 [Chlorella vulgaris]